MKCPYCETDNDKVVDSRVKDNGFAIRRRRYCTQCSRRYTTYERIEAASVKVVKKDGTRAPFEREKLRSGIEILCRRNLDRGQFAQMPAVFLCTPTLK